MSDKRLLQVFISDTSINPGPGIFEVSTDKEKNLTCTCPGFAAKTDCKHTALVEKKIEKNDGVYPFDFSESITVQEITDAMKNEELFRKLVIKHGRVEVI